MFVFSYALFSAHLIDLTTSMIGKKNIIKQIYLIKLHKKFYKQKSEILFTPQII